MQYIRRHFHTTAAGLKTVPKNLKGKSKSSQEWLTRQLNDPYVKKAQDMNYRARSAFKLLEMDDKIKILKPGLTVVECGAAPGAWTQAIVQRINSDGNSSSKPIGKVIGIDLLPISPLNGAILLPGCDFTCSETQKKIQDLLNLPTTFKPGVEKIPEGSNSINTVDKIDPRNMNLIDLVVSDMAPSATGTRDIDHPRIITLVRNALKFAVENGKPGGHFLTKIWDGHETQKLELEMNHFYHKVLILKPPCSRSDSAEIFLFAKSKRS